MNSIAPKPNDTIPSTPGAGARRDAAVLALHVARTRIDELTVEYARRGGLDTNARRAVQILGCFAPVLTAIENLMPEAGEAREFPADPGPFADCRCGRTHTRQGWGELAYVGPLDDGKDVLEMRRCMCGLTLGVAVGPSPTPTSVVRPAAGERP